MMIFCSRSSSRSRILSTWLSRCSWAVSCSYWSLRSSSVAANISRLAGAEAVAVAVLVGDGAGEVLHDRPTGVGAELVAPGEVELLDRPDQRHVAVADQLEEVLRRPDVPLGDRHDQPQVRPNDLVLRRHRLRRSSLSIWSISAALGPRRIELARGACSPCTSGSSSCGTGGPPAPASAAAPRTGWPGRAAGRWAAAASSRGCSTRGGGAEDLASRRFSSRTRSNCSLGM